MSFDLDAALADPEGQELVRRILDRKHIRNLREGFLQQLIWGDVHTDGHGNVIPRPEPEPEYWAAVRKAWNPEGWTVHGVPQYTPLPLKVLPDVRPENVRWAYPKPAAVLPFSHMEQLLSEQRLAAAAALECFPYNRKLFDKTGQVSDHTGEEVGVKPGWQQLFGSISGFRLP